MRKLQVRILYREFLFRLVDRDVLSVSAQGDASRLLGQIATLLILLSIPFTFPVLALDNRHLPHDQLRVAAWSAEHALIATTMLIVGLFGVLSWESGYPDRRDALVLGPLPVPASVIFLSKIAALAVALSLTVVLFNMASFLVLPLALAPSDATPLDLLLSVDTYRLIAAFWITMFASGAFILCSILAVQGIIGQLPRRFYLQGSAFLQLAFFSVLLIGYFLEPSFTSLKALTAPQNQSALMWLPSYWFLGLFQQLNGSVFEPARPVLMMLAGRAWIALGISIVITGGTFFLSYFRTIREILEQPDIVASVRRVNWLPPVGNRIETAITHFSLRTLFRSRQHRVLLAFYAGLGLAVVILFSKMPEFSNTSAHHIWHQPSLPLLASSFVMLCAWILGLRVVFRIPLELRANWIFRITQIHPANAYFAATHRAVYVVALAPVWITTAALFLVLWPLHQALGHLIVLLLLGILLVEWWLHGFHIIPFACSYLPGRTNLHITFLLCLMLGLNAIYWSAEFERRALSDPHRFAWMIAVLTAAVLFAWWRRANATSDAELRYQEEVPPVITSLKI